MAVHDRRTFLKCAGAAAVGVGLRGGNAMAEDSYVQGRDPVSSELVVKIDTPDAPRVSRVFAILKDRIEARCPARVVLGAGRVHIILAVDKTLPAEAFRIEDTSSAVRVAGGSSLGLLYGVGKFLRTSGYDAGFRPCSPWRGTSVPQGSLRGMYFATHFHNWYHQASAPEIARYMEDLALWGVNAIMVVFPMINLQDWDDPQAEPAMAMVRQYAETARELGLQFVTGVNNTMFIGAPKEIPRNAAARPNPSARQPAAIPICPSNPEGHAYLMANTKRLFEKLSDVGLDGLCHWPYDEGGCACEKCMPWGANGYLKLSRDLTELADASYFPNLKSNPEHLDVRHAARRRVARARRLPGQGRRLDGLHPGGRARGFPALSAGCRRARATAPCSTSRRSACGATGRGAAWAPIRSLLGFSDCGIR